MFAPGDLVRPVGKSSIQMSTPISNPAVEVTYKDAPFLILGERETRQHPRRNDNNVVEMVPFTYIQVYVKGIKAWVRESLIELAI
jgi:hypothetical protein